VVPAGQSGAGVSVVRIEIYGTLEEYGRLIVILARFMRASLATTQVGNNVDVPQGPAAHVSAPAEFEKYADLLPRYFGPPSPKSTVVATPQMSSPDLLLKVEPFAAIR
jgi:hypothetical protein